MGRTNVPLCLKHAREEVLKALSADCAEDEGTHRKRADRYVSEAVQLIEHEPDLVYDWSDLRESV